MEPEPHKAAIRFYEIDLLRFLAAFVVVVFHLSYRGYTADNLSPVGYPALAPFVKYGYLGVELFFMISGYVILMSAQGKTVKQFFVSRIMRLYPAFWVACTLTFVAVRLFGPRPGDPNWSHYMDLSLTQYGFNMTMLHNFFGFGDVDGTYWTLSVEIAFYFLISLLIAYHLFDALIPLLTGWLLYSGIAPYLPSGAPFTKILVLSYAPLFAAGMLFYMLQHRQAATWKLYLLLAISLVLAIRNTNLDLVGVIAHHHDPFSHSVVTAIIASFFLVFLLIVWRVIDLQRFTWLSTLGNLTYPLYLLHHNLGYLLLQHFGGKINPYVLLVSITLLMIIAAGLVHVLVEKKYSKRLGKSASGWFNKLALLH
ncbi:acyltransferase family protein [Hymenobacter jejuensis]|uniref:Acyltransferase n=1 Tax=Hymenobacter jejuensis TaxID=2502781 RepID=A0A5B8A3G5_9BACT|nr:acyltransferase [Hymenobacter jejuensis]QDA61828.1 acyltransferase [Hymenobacter jejuensis]